jgi:putative transposase
MRPGQYIISSARVCAWLAGLVVAKLVWKDHGKVRAGLLARLVLLAAASRTSLSGLCKATARGPCAESVRQALLANLPRRRAQLEAALVAALHACLPDGMPDRLVMALDFHQRPFYGKRRRHQSRPGKKRQGAKRFWCYATLSAFWQGRRFSVGLCCVRRGVRLATAVRRLLAQAACAGLAPSLLLLDREFYAKEVINLLKARGTPFVMPMQRKGKKPQGGNRRFFEPSLGPGWYVYGWESPKRVLERPSGKRVKRGSGTAEVEVCVGRHPVRGEPLVFACSGVWGMDPRDVVRLYRCRFGIESSYRLLGQCLARTCSCNERVRLLYVGVALLIGNGWALLRHHDLLDEQAGRAEGACGRLALPTLLLHLAAYLAEKLTVDLRKTTASASLDRTLPQNDPYDYSG